VVPSPPRAHRLLARSDAMPEPVNCPVADAAF